MELQLAGDLGDVDAARKGGKPGEVNVFVLRASGSGPASRAASRAASRKGSFDSRPGSKQSSRPPSRGSSFV